MKLQRPLIAALLFILFSVTASAVEPPFFDRLQAVLQARDVGAFLNLVSSNPALQDQERKLMADLVAFQPVRTVMRLAKSQDNQMQIQVLMQAQEEARFELWSIETGIENSRTVIQSHKILSTVEGLYRLRMSPSSYPVQNVEVHHFDALVRMESGHLFPITAGGEIAGALFIGRGTFTFAPRDPTEQQQLGIFCKKPRLETALQYFYIRASANNLKKYFASVLTEEQTSDTALYQTATDIAKESDQDAFGVRLPFSDELWFPRTQGDDLYSEIKSDVGTLVYQFAPNEEEDIMLVQKEHDHILSLYSTEGRHPHIAEAEDFRILSYKMNLTYDPGNTYLSGTSEILLSAQGPSTSAVFKLNPALRVSSIESSQGELLYFQEKTTFNLHVVLNDLLDEGNEVLLRFHYDGKIPQDRGRTETQSPNTPNTPTDRDYFLPPTFLYSNQALWYPQLVSKPYSQVETTVRVPSGYAAIANGVLVNQEERGNSIVYSYSADLPVKYFSLLVGRLRGNMTKQSVVPIRTYFYDIDKSSASKLADKADDILRFYSNYFGRYPYRNLNLALRPAFEPGGHAPAGMVITNRIYAYMKLKFERDPLWIPEFPDFLLAHEIAHQWWGQAVGWRNYRDQWLSEGFAQFAAAEYIRSEYGDKAWLKLSDDFSGWIKDKTAAGPIILGTRLGHLTGDPRAFSALLYNKGAYILNMLKNWMGADNFTKCLQEYYTLYQFKRAGIQDFTEIAQRHSPDNLTDFFEQWLYGWTVPDVKWSWTVSGAPDAPMLKVRFEQSRDNFFHLKIPVEAQGQGGQVFRFEALVDKPVTDVEVQLPFAPVRVVADPLHEDLMTLTPQK